MPRIALVGLIFCLLAGSASAVTTSHWTHTTEADFEQGTFKNVVTTNLGDLKLSRQVTTILAQDARVSAVYALAQTSDGTIYAGTGPQGILLQVKDDKVSTAADLGTHTNIYSLMVDAKGRLLIGTGGEKGEIYRIDKPGSGEKPKSIFASDDVQYIWAMTQTPDGLIYAATGPNGQLIQINPDDSNKVLYDSDENNLLCLLSDGKDNLYIGTDPNGLVVRVNRANGNVFVVYDAPETEVSTLLRDGQGNLYAATSQAIEAEGAVEEAGESEQVGRPESEQHGVPIPSNPPPNPKPPEVPGPGPGEPLPIPKTDSTKTLSMMIMAEDEPAGGGGGDEPSPGAPGGSPATSPTRAAGTRRAEQNAPAANPSGLQATGNAIYRIDPDGFVTEVFRQPVSVFAMLDQGGTLLVATGSDGKLYQVNPAAEETLVLAKVDPKDVLCLLRAKDGRIFMGLANSGGVATLASGFASDGTYTSPVLDATQISRFGKIQLRGTLPQGTGLKLATRSGNVEEASAPGWSDWSSEISATEFLQIPSPPARFLQYRLTFLSNGGKTTPVVEDIDVAYQVPNQSPQIKSVKIAPVASEPAAAATGSDDRSATPTSKMTISWDATDPNEDELQYKIYIRNSPAGEWILIKDKLKDPTWDWETRNVADGRYEVKIEASDAAANPAGQGKTASRVSDPVMVDNTAPVIGDVKTSVSGSDANIGLKVVDRTTTVASLEYSVDSARDWQTVLPSDKIADSPEESYQFVVGKLSAGPHQITVRASDEKGNRSYESLSVVVENK